MIGAWTHWLSRYDARTRIRALATGSVAGPKPQVSVRVHLMAERVRVRIPVRGAPLRAETPLVLAFPRERYW